jgi:hypothetical protein
MSNPFTEPTSNNPYSSTGSYSAPEPQGPPQVILWCKLFCGAMALLCFGAAGFSMLTLIILSNPAVLPPEQAVQINSIRAVYGTTLALSLIAAVLYLIFPILPKKPSTWVYGMVLIGLSLLTICGALPAIILMIFWANERTRKFYGITS